MSIFDLPQIRQIIELSRGLTRTRIPLHSQSSLNPVFIVGSGRSGNTLIRRVLMASNEIYIPPETYVIGQILRQFTSLSHLSWRNLVLLAIGGISTSEDIKYFPACDYHKIFSEIEKFEKSKRTCADFLDAIYRHWSIASGMKAVRWGDKTPMNAFSLDYITRAFPDSQFVYVQRSVYDVVASYLAMGRYSNAREATQRWMLSNQMCVEARDRHPDQFITVTYEDMVSEPMRIFPLVFSHLGINFKEEVLSRPAANLPMGDQKAEHYANLRKNISSDSVGRGRLSLSKAQLSEVDKALSESNVSRRIFRL